jgi:pre-rRNA-processing protein TSR2
MPNKSLITPLFDIMASQQSSSSTGPTPIPQNTGYTQQELEIAFDHSIWYLISLWPAMRAALENSWGGPDSSDKRNWFAGAVSEYLNDAKTDVQQEDLEDMLVQIMGDEFECNVEDESESAVAGDILKVRQRLFVEERTLVASQEVEQRWRNRGSMKHEKLVVQEVNQDVDREEDYEFVDGDGDEEMDEAPALVRAPKEKVIPEVDDDGFQKVVGKKRTGGKEKGKSWM